MIRKLEKDDLVDMFDCGQQDLNRFLQRFAWENQKANSAQTYVAFSGSALVGYYSLSAGSASYTDAPERIAKGLARHPIPTMVLARLAIDSRFQGQGLGSGMLKDAFLNTLRAADIAGIRAIVVHAKDGTALQWYSRFDFEPSPTIPKLMFLLLKDAQRAVR